jgi:serine/threonine protein kinase
VATDPDRAQPPTIQLEAGTLVAGKYRLVRPAGFGGMAAIWVARNEATGAEVAVKLLLADRATSREAFERFRREAHAAAQLSHRAIVRVFDLLELADAPGSLAMVMELLHGRTLMDAMEDKKKFTVEETLEVMMPVLSGLSHAHRAGIVHRDLKPENIFLAVDPDEHVTPKILDFGISKLTNAQAPTITTDGALLGTPGYMSPEQARGAIDADARSDVFTIGILMYEMLSGHNPFSSGSYHSVVAAILERDPDPLTDIPQRLWAVIERTLAKKPADRYANAQDVAVAIRGAVGALAPRPSATSLMELPILVPSSEPSSVPSIPSAGSSGPFEVRPAVRGDIALPVRSARRLVAVLVGLALAGGVFALWVGARPAASAPTPTPPPSVSAASTYPPPPPISAVGSEPAPPGSSSAPAATARPSASTSRVPVAKPAPSASGRARTTVVRDPGF